MKKPLPNDRHVVVGTVGRVHGVKGWVSIQSDTEPHDNIFDYQPWALRIQGEWQSVTVTASQRSGGKLIAQFDDCQDREIAKRYTNADIGVFRSQLPDLPEGEYYWSDLEGLNVVTTQGETLGKVDHLLPTGAHDVLVIQGETQTLIPYVMDRFVKHIDVDKQTITVDWDADWMNEA